MKLETVRHRELTRDRKHLDHSRPGFHQVRTCLHACGSGHLHGDRALEHWPLVTDEVKPSAFELIDQEEFSPVSYRPRALAMSLLVRDEADILAENLRYHFDHGVDYFVVTDNGSVDGTREIIESLAREMTIFIIDEPNQTFDQDRWVTRMAEIARDRLSADWIIQCDADEFWHSTSGSLKDSITSDVGVFSCRRFNMLPTTAALNHADYSFYHNIHRVARPFPPHPPRPDHKQSLDYPLFMREMLPKVMCSLKGLQRVHMGNHDVDHTSQVRPTNEQVSIFHYPIRSFSSFERTVMNYGHSIRRSSQLEPGSLWHLRRLAALHTDGLLEEFYQSAIQEVEIEAQQPNGRVTTDYTIWDIFAQHNDNHLASRDPPISLD